MPVFPYRASTSSRLIAKGKAASKGCCFFVMLSKTLVEEFRQICREEYGIEMSGEDAACDAAWLAEYFDALASGDAASTEHHA